MLRKICNHPDLTTEAGSLWKLRKDEAERKNTPSSREESDGGYGCWKRAGKLIVVQSLLKLWRKQKHKVLLFTQTRQVSHVELRKRIWSLPSGLDVICDTSFGSVCMSSRSEISRKNLLAKTQTNYTRYVSSKLFFLGVQ